MSSGGDMTDPANDLNDAYAVIPTPAELRGPPPDWWTVTANCVPVWHFAPDANYSSVRRRSPVGWTNRFRRQQGERSNELGPPRAD